MTSSGFHGFLALIAALLVGLSSCSGGGGNSTSGSMDWKLFRGDASLSGYTNTSLPKEPSLKWTYTGVVRTVSSPVIDNGTTYWVDRKGLVTGVSIDGAKAFEFDLQTSVEATPMICDSTLYVGRIDGFLSAISLSRRDTIWNYETLGQISASPNLMDFEGRKAIVFGSYDNFLYVVEAETGKELSKFESGYYLNGAAALWRGHVIYGGCDSWVRIINCETGLSTDSLLLDAYVPASPAIMGDYCYIGDYAGNIYKLLLENGKIARHKKIAPAGSESGSFVSVPAVSSDAFYFFSGDRNLQAVSRVDGKMKWKYMMKGNVGESSPLVCNDKIVVCTKTGIVSILDAATGKLLWEYDAGEQIVGSPAVIKGRLMILTSKGTLLCFGEKYIWNR
jgi:outer membrane protein assembly factor BamB